MANNNFGATGMPFDDIRALLENLPGPNEQARQACRAREAQLTKPPGSLGQLETIVEWVSGWQGQHPPKMQRPVVAVFAGNHGIAAKGVSAYPVEVTAQMVKNFQSGGAAVNQICESFGLGLKVFELALELPTGDITAEAAFEEDACAATIAYGMEAIAGGCDLLCVGEMGIGNTAVASALLCALFGGDAKDWVGPGTGVSGTALMRKTEAVAMALQRHRTVIGDPLEALRSLGGREIAAMTGAILAARLQNVPVLIDGFVATAAAAVLFKLQPSAIDHCLAAHLSSEPAHAKALQEMQLRPILDLGLRLGEASGAALAAGLVKAAVATHNGMATFSQAGVSDSEAQDRSIKRS